MPKTNTEAKTHLPFKKKNAFTYIETLKYAGKQPLFSHPIEIIKKKRKESLWFSKVVYSKQLAIIETVVQEIFRLLNPDQPKTRWIEEIANNGTVNYCVISKEVSGFNTRFFEGDYIQSIKSGQFKNLALTLVASLFIDEVDLKVGNIGIKYKKDKDKEFFNVIKLDGGLGLAAINPDYQGYLSERSSHITKEDIEALPNLNNFHAYNWIGFVQCSYNQATLEKLLPILENSYFDTNEFKKNIETLLKNKPLHERVKYDVQLILAQANIADLPLFNLLLKGWHKELIINEYERLLCHYPEIVLQKIIIILENSYFKSEQFNKNIKKIKHANDIKLQLQKKFEPLLAKSALPNFDLLQCILYGFTKERVLARLNWIRLNSEIASDPSFIEARNRAILQISSLPEALIDKLVKSYVSAEDIGLAVNIKKFLIERQQQLIQESYKITNYRQYAESESAQTDRIAFTNSLTNFTTMHKVPLLTDAKEIYKKFVPGYALIYKFNLELIKYIETKNKILNENIFDPFQKIKEHKLLFIKNLHSYITDYLNYPDKSLNAIIAKCNTLMTRLKRINAENNSSIPIVKTFINNLKKITPLLKAENISSKNPLLFHTSDIHFFKTQPPNEVINNLRKPAINFHID